MPRASSSARLCRVVVVTGLMLFLACLSGWTVYEFLVVNEGLQYFAARPRRLAYVAGIALAGGGLLLAFCRLPPRIQRVFSLAFLGASALGATGFLGMLVHNVASLPPPPPAVQDSDGLWWVMAVFGLVTAYLWFQFVTLWRSPA